MQISMDSKSSEPSRLRGEMMDDISLEREREREIFKILCQGWNFVLMAVIKPLALRFWLRSR